MYVSSDCVVTIEVTTLNQSIILSKVRKARQKKAFDTVWHLLSLRVEWGCVHV